MELYSRLRGNFIFRLLIAVFYFFATLSTQVVKVLPPAPEALQGLSDLPTRSTKMPNDLKKVREGS